MGPTAPGYEPERTPGPPGPASVTAPLSAEAKAPKTGDGAALLTPVALLAASTLTGGALLLRRKK